ncbi:ANTAR domain-containing protein [uncultured Kocuria sp.]|uniref:ANTAR domain-containing protein n=1 Tax=uncultured Kocuria sp. TaxID=259305 RepID=UPI00262E96A1|nr:ANTAR domain-containing protein [uncultured Kocuria sp.]
MAGRLHDAVAGRPEIQQAVGLLMERHDLEADPAHARLRAAAHQQHLPVLELAGCLLHHAEDPRL